MEWWEKIKKLIEEKMPKNQEDFIELGKAFDDKVKEEVKQLQDLGGIGAYVAQNVTTVAAKAARSVGLEEDAHLIEYLSSDAVRNGQEFDNKIKGAVKLVKENGLNATMADKGITVMVKAARKLGQEGLAEKVESKREAVVGVGQRIDNKVKEEYRQMKDMGGVGAYVAQNGTTVVAEAARRLGREDLAEKVEAEREVVVGVGQRIDNKVKEEYQQLKDMGGVGAYVAQNGSTVVDEAAKRLGHEDLTQKIEAEREALVGAGQRFDNRLNLRTDKENAVINNIEQGAPVVMEGGLENKGALGVSSYTNAKICHLTTKDGGVVDFTLLDGKKHGAEIHYAANGEISKIKVFDHGKEIPVDKRNVEIRKEVVEMGTHSYCLLDGKPFGTEFFTSTDGKARASFYEDGGFSVSRKSYSELSYVSEPFEQYLLHRELAQQKGNLREGGIAGLRNNRIEQRLESRYAVASVSEPPKKQTIQTDVLAYAVQTNNIKTKD